MTMQVGTDARSAVFSPDRVYRYGLSILLHPMLSPDAGHAERLRRAERCLFIMLNPSKANEHRNDPTVKRCVRFARYWGYGHLDVGNLYALASTDPKALWAAEDPVGPHNDDQLMGKIHQSNFTLVAWGANAKPERSKHVIDMIEGRGVTPHALAITNAGEPKHPLYLSYDLRPTSLRELRDHGQTEKTAAVQPSD